MLLTHQRFARRFQQDTSVEGLHRHLVLIIMRVTRRGGFPRRRCPETFGVPIHEGRCDVTRRRNRQTLFQPLAYTGNCNLCVQILA
jgi:hypothetical protein